jgi:hypothetical protein
VLYFAVPFLKLNPMRPIYGKLVQTLPSGKQIVLVHKDLWGNLENEKKLRIQQGVPAEQLKKKYL